VKKFIVLSLVVCFVLAIAGTALAFPIDFSGDFRLQARSLNDVGDNGVFHSPVTTTKVSFWQFRARLGFEGKVDDSTSFYGRLGVRNQWGGASNTDGQTQLDQYGMKFKGDNWNVVLGRQAVNLGQGTIISTGSDVGIDSKFDGIVATTKTGAFAVTLIGGKTTNTGGAAPTEWYGFDASVPVSDQFNVGFAYARSKVNISDPNFKWTLQGVNTWALNATVKTGSALSFSGEYAKSNVPGPNHAYFLAGTYGWDKDSFTVQYNNVGTNAVDPSNSGIGAIAYPFGRGLWDNSDTAYKGFTYIFQHQMTKAASFHIIYMDLKKTPETFETAKEVVGGVVWKF